MQKIIHNITGLCCSIKKSELKHHIQNVFRRARILSDTDFEIRKGGLAEEMISWIKPSQPNNDVAKMIGAFLLRPEIIPVLEERLLLSFRD